MQEFFYVYFRAILCNNSHNQKQNRRENKTRLFVLFAIVPNLLYNKNRTKFVVDEYRHIVYNGDNKKGGENEWENDKSDYWRKFKATN